MPSDLTLDAQTLRPPWWGSEPERVRLLVAGELGCDPNGGDVLHERDDQLLERQYVGDQGRVAHAQRGDVHLSSVVADLEGIRQRLGRGQVRGGCRAVFGRGQVRGGCRAVL